MAPESETGDARPRPDPLDRPWLHPSELRSAPVAAPRGRRREWLIGLGAGILASLGTIVILAFAGVFTGAPATPTTALPAAPATTTSAFTQVAAIANSAGPAVVAVSVNGTRARAASGVCIDSEGHVITSRTATSGATEIEVIGSDGTAHPATLLGSDPATDIAVLRVPGRCEAARLGETSDLKEQAMVVALGAANQFDHWHATGTVEDVAASGRALDGTVIHGLIETDAEIAPTAAGGALVDRAGRVIGILLRTETAGQARPTAHALPIEGALAVARQVQRHGIAVHPWLGVNAADGNPGARLQGVSADSPAAEAGLRAGDVLLTADGVAIPGADDLSALILRQDAGARLVFTVQRGEARFTVTAVLAAGGPPTITTPPPLVAAVG